MRVLWYSNAPWAATGYGQQTALNVPRLQALGHDVAVAAFHGLQGVPLHWGGMTVYPGSTEDPWAQDVLLGHYQQHKADLLITLMDAWVLDAAKLSDAIGRGMRVVHWQPVDCEPLSALDHRILTECGTRPIAMSRHGERMMAAFDPLYVPHSVDTEVFRPVSDEVRADAREKGGFGDMFLIGINAANQDPVRKGFGEQLAAFRLFVDRHPDARMLIHTRKVTRQGANLDKILEVLQLQPYVQFGDQYLTVTGMTSAAEIAKWYGICDLVSNCSYGEGFGLPVLEAQACGTPVAVTDCSSMTELCGAGWKVDGEYYWNAGHSAWWTRPSIAGILEAYEQAYAEARDPKLRERAREFALGYDADLVTKQYWDPVLDELEGFGGTVRHGGLRWATASDHDDAGVRAVLELLPEGGVLADLSAATGDLALPAARKASRVIALGGDMALGENLTLNGITNVAVQDVLDVSAEPFIDVVRLDWQHFGLLDDILAAHRPVLAVRDGKGRHGLQGKLDRLGYGRHRLVAGSRCVIVVPA